MEYGFLSLVPPLAAILFALLTRQIYIALFGGILLGEWIMADFSFFTALNAALERLIAVFAEAWVVKVIFFAFLVGAIIVLITVSGGVAGFIDVVSRRFAGVQSRRGALLLAYFTGIAMFVESSITALVSGTVAKPLTDRCLVPREKLAYVCDSVSAPVCSMIPFNAWGALLLGLITAQITAGVISGQAIDILAQAVMLNFYAIAALLTVLVIIWTGKDFGPMKRAEIRAKEQGKLLRDGARPVMDESMMGLDAAQGVRPDIWNMILPLAVLIIMVPMGLLITGEGDMLKGSGSTAIFWAVLGSVVFSGIFFRIKGVMKLDDFISHVNRGSSAMFPVVAILIFAFAIGALTGDMKTGEYLAHVAQGIVSPHLVAVIVFVMAGIIAFSTGTSWGTFSIMMPIAIHMAVGLDAHIPLVVAAVISGGVFGDHCSVISDTTIVSSMASGCDHIDHVNTQLPYALLSGAIAALLFVVFGWVL